ncbi:SGNH/GDSL hydrolase family protein [Sciscionella sediminilitoris]|uniref:SGNH/GDSL hydrolase family protein n=1 Tax=Sciscionella sediminilitoris TaxID=1445613 RepID=UPI0004DF9C63|nr:SGNH/GDSL hydrolase family protein [Sciscionella sp. SE31]
MRKLLGLAGACALGVGILGSLGAAPANATQAANYVALGDSYSAGVGSGDYDPDSGNCKRSANAYPKLWADANKPASFSFVACLGAKTGDVLSDQLSALSSSTSLVSINIGGNDAGFTPTLTSCITGGDAGCKTATDKAIDYVHKTLPGQLDTTYQKIKAAAPNAKLVVLGYSRLYKIGGSCSVGLSDTSRGYINNAADELDTEIAARAKAAGATFADVRSAFAPHLICTSDPWLHSTTWPVDESYHPNKKGQSEGYLPAFSAASKAAAAV